MLATAESSEVDSQCLQSEPKSARPLPFFLFFFFFFPFFGYVESGKIGCLPSSEIGVDCGMDYDGMIWCSLNGIG